MSRVEQSGRIARILLLTGLLVVVAAALVWAQTTTGSIRGRVVSESGEAVAAASIRVVNVATGVERTTITQPGGQYLLVGLKPGTYDLEVGSIGYRTQRRQVQVLVGQALAVDLQLTAEAVSLEGITVVGTRVAEVKTPEVALNVTQEQIQALPQPDRNFLNFAGLAAGITVSRNEMNKFIQAGGLPATKVNVFVDGASFKNDILEGGVHGQDASRGNPFPQIAIQEFRVVTQNFKAEYQRAGAAVVTATTRSGTNELEVSGFLLGQNRDLVARDPGSVIICSERQGQNPPLPCDPKPAYERLQAGLAIGGPIIRDRLHYFVGYEGNYQNRQEQVRLQRQEFRNLFGQYEGEFEQPFRSSLFFGKLSYVPAPNQTLELSYNGRFESDKRGFGGTTSFESAENVAIGTNVVTLQHTVSRGDWFNQAHVSAQRATWNPTVVNEDLDVGYDYMGVFRIGARSTEQRFVQDRLALRNDLSYAGWEGHLIKGGVNVDLLNYDVEKLLDGNPVYSFDTNVSMTVPVRAFWGSGDPGLDQGNVQFGVFLQDDWDVTPRLQLNLGVRWDAETNQFNNEWVTPDSIRTRAGPILTQLGLDPEDYFTDGREDRPMFLGAFQPRLGFSYDVLGNGRTVLHGGWGVYYDREIWNHLIDESHRLTWVKRSFEFTTTGEPNKIPWNDQYLTRAGLQSLIDQVNPFIANEVFLFRNDSRPPRTQQWNIGVRQGVAGLIAGAAYRGVRGENLTSWYCAKAHSEHGYCEGTMEMGAPFKILLSTDEGRTWYDAFDLTLEKPFTADSRWGFTLAYTFADAERKGAEFFTLEHPDVDPADWPVVRQKIERHRLSASGIVALPYDMRLSTLVQLGSGIPFNRIDETIGWGPRRARVDFASEDAPNFRQVDLRLQKDFTLPRGGRIGLIAEAVNVFNHDNFREYEELWKFGGGGVNDNFAKPRTWTADQGRRYQLGLDFGF